MRNLREMLYRFMYGRYGNDQLNIALTILYMIIMVVNIFLRIRIIYYLDNILIILIFARMLSRNIAKRRLENERFLNFKTTAYHRCPNCRSVCRLPRKRGSFTIKCPNCNTRFKIRNWF